MPSASAVSRRRWIPRDERSSDTSLAGPRHGRSKVCRSRSRRRPLSPANVRLKVRSSTSISSPLRAPWSCPASSRREPSSTPGRRLRNSPVRRSHTRVSGVSPGTLGTLPTARAGRPAARPRRSQRDRRRWRPDPTSPARSGSPRRPAASSGSSLRTDACRNHPRSTSITTATRALWRERLRTVRSWRTSWPGRTPGTSRRCARSSGSHGSWVRSRVGGLPFR